MKIMITQTKDIEPFFKMLKLESELSAVLTTFKSEQKYQLKRLTIIKKKANELSKYKTGTFEKWFKEIDDGTKKAINKYKEW